MNFFGHAAVASSMRDDPGFVLGAMLPDLAAMIRARPPRVRGEPLSAGVAFHHRTDQAFHNALTFRGLVRQALEDLTARGLGRGSARAVAHVGVEILLDGELAGEIRARHAYGRALAASSVLLPSIAWTEHDARSRFAELCVRLEIRGAVADDVSPELVAYRLQHALYTRPRLALGKGDTTRIVDWVTSVRPAVIRAVPQLMSELYQGLVEVGASPTSPTIS